MTIPFFTLDRQYLQIKNQLDEAVMSTISASRFVGGPTVDEFARAFSQAIGAKNCIPVANGTDALFISLKALGIGAGDEVITPALSWISSAETITLCGAHPVFADIDQNLYTITARTIEKQITPRTKAVVVVHLYGQPAPMSEIQSLCRKHNLLLIEDCAQAHLTKIGHAYAGTFGDAAAFSFYPTKNLGAYGDAGCITTASATLAEKMKRLANHGALQKDDHEMEGTNSRMDALQAAVLMVKLKHLPAWNAARIGHAQHYSRLLKAVSQVQTPPITENGEHTFHIYAIRAQRRDALQQFLRDGGIETLIHYPKALPHVPAYRHLNHNAGDFPEAEKLTNEVLSLPVYPELEKAELEYICEKIAEFYRK